MAAPRSAAQRRVALCGAVWRRVSKEKWPIKASADHEGGSHSFGGITPPQNHYATRKTMKLQNYKVASFWLRRTPWACSDITVVLIQAR